MNQNKHQSNFKPAQIRRIASVLLGSIFASALITAGSAFAESTVSSKSSPLNRIAASTPLSEAVKAAPTTPASGKIAQASDVAGNWAEPFIKVLVEKEIIKGYPDGTFRPDQPINRAEFAALLNRAFSLELGTNTRKFKDVPKKYWATEVIQKAVSSGFMIGYPNGTFAPKQNITRIQSLVALVNGSKLEPNGTLDLNGVFGDASQVPGYGQNALIAATQRCIAVSQEYDSSKLPGGNFGPEMGATRADVAAYIHQVLVGAGKLPALDKASPGNKYIASCPQGAYVATITGNPEVKPPDPTTTSKITKEEALTQLKLPLLPVVPGGVPTTAYPVGGLASPTAFGANGGNAFAGVSYQNTTRPQIYNASAPTSPQGINDGAVSLGFGLGDAKNFVALETIATSYSTFRSGFGNQGALSFKLHKALGDSFAIAGGYENAILWGSGNDGGQTGYGVASLVLNPDPNIGFFSNTTVSVGAGAGRFRNVGDIRTGKDSYNVFGSIGTRLSPNFSLIADWNGQDLSVGLPITIPFGGANLQVTPSLVDLVNKETGGSRFVVNAGVGFQF
jgi:S-layer homology domain